MKAARLVATGVVAGLAYRAFLSPCSQTLGPFPVRGGGDERAVALTFDDGPNEPFTSQIGAYLAEQGIVGTFFQVGKCVERFPGTSRHLLSQGHVLGNHSYSHSVLRCVTPGSQRRETMRTQQALTEAIGRRPALY